MQNVIAAAVAAAIVTGGAVYIAQMPKPPKSEIGRFQFMKSGETGIWRLDTETGDVNICYARAGKDLKLSGCVELNDRLTFGDDTPPEPNYFDKYDPPAPTPPGENPFAKYQQQPASKK